MLSDGHLKGITISCYSTVAGGILGITTQCSFNAASQFDGIVETVPNYYAAIDMAFATLVAATIGKSAMYFTNQDNEELFDTVVGMLPLSAITFTGSYVIARPEILGLG